MARRTTDRKARGMVVGLIADVFFGISVRNAIRKLGFEAQIIKSLDDLDQTVAVYEPDMLVVDMSLLGSDEENWEAVRDAQDAGVRVLAFGPHREVELFKAAKATGVDRVVSNSQFHREMGALIERYALEPDEPVASKPADGSSTDS